MALATSNPVSAQGSNATSVTSPSFTSTTGDLLVVCCANDGHTEAATPITDNGTSNTWASSVALVGNGQGTGYSQKHAANINGRSGHTVTYTLSASGFPSIAVIEISGAATSSPLDKNTSNSGAGQTNPHTSGTTATTTQADEICVAGMTHGGGSSETFSSNNGYTVQTSQTSTANMPVVLSTKIVSSTGGQVESYNLSPNSSVNWAGGIATYKAAAAAAAGGSLWPAHAVGVTRSPFAMSGRVATTWAWPTGPMATTVTATDTLSGLSDVATRATQAASRSASDALTALSDLASRSLQAFSRSASDSPSAPTDTATRAVQTSARSASDTLTGLTDGATRAFQAALRTVTESLAAMSDAATRALQVVSRTTTDSPPSPSDTAARSAQASGRSSTDPLSATTDSATRSVQHPARTATDAPPGLTDSAIRALQSFTRSASESLAALSDQAFKAGSHATVTATDALAAVSDAATRVAQHPVRSSADALAALTDVASRSVQAALRAGTDALATLADLAHQGTLVVRDVALFLGRPLSGWVMGSPVSGWTTGEPASGWVTGQPRSEE